MSTPTNKSLYKRVISQAKKRFEVYPSAYANVWVSRHYKSLGGKYKGKKGTSLTKSIRKIKRRTTRKRK